MNIELRFKAWDKQGKFFHAPMTIHQMLDICSLPSDSVTLLATKFKITRNSLEFCQYLGHRDKNDKEIYVGDIIQWDYEYDSDYDGDMPIVKRSTGKRVIKHINDTSEIITARQEGKGCEVIGHIFETPDFKP